MYDELLHFVAGAVFAKNCQAADPQAAGREYADFYFRFAASYAKRLVELENEGDDYRYGDILSPGRAASQAAPAPQQQHPAAPQRTAQPPKEGESDSGRTF